MSRESCIFVVTAICIKAINVLSTSINCILACELKCVNWKDETMYCVLFCEVDNRFSVLV